MLWKKYIDHLSVSQIKTHMRSPKRWAIEKLEKIPTETSSALEMGSKIHKALEHTISFMEIPSGLDEIENKCCQACLYFWLSGARHIKGTFLEEYFKLSLGDGLPPLIGYVDYMLKDYKGNILIGDHKTSKSGASFLKQHELKDDLQLCVYAKHFSDVHDQDIYGKLSGYITLEHMQYKYGNKKKILNVIQDDVSVEHINRVYEEMVTYVREKMLPTLELYDKGGIDAISEDSCQTCRHAFGPNSCEFYGQYCCNNLTKNLTLGIIKEKGEKVQEGDSMKVCKLKDMMAKAREKTEAITNTWDRRDKQTALIMKHVEDNDFGIIEAPSHFIGGTIHPDYMDVITQLKEKGYRVYLKI